MPYTKRGIPVPDFGFNQGSTPRHKKTQSEGYGNEADKRRSEIARHDDQTATESITKGQILVVGAGEVILPVVFPVWYIEPPQFYFGGALASNSPTEPGLFPTISSVVGDWEVERPDLENFGFDMRIYYRGAQLAVVTQGQPEQEMYLHYTFSGLAVTNPVFGFDVFDLDTPI